MTSLLMILIPNKPTKENIQKTPKSIEKIQSSSNPKNLSLKMVTIMKFEIRKILAKILNPELNRT
jgi:hypothetical protein